MWAQRRAAFRTPLRRRAAAEKNARVSSAFSMLTVAPLHLLSITYFGDKLLGIKPKRGVWVEQQSVQCVAQAILATVSGACANHHLFGVSFN